MNFYPWQQSFWQKWQVVCQRPAQSYLLLGTTAGAYELVQGMAQSLLCEQGGCGICTTCQQFVAGVHPDFYELSRPEGKKEIPVDGIRQLSQWVVEAPHMAKGVKVVWLHPADAMNTSAANALLKTLEEPPSHVVFLLQAQDLSHVLPTIRSRCQLLHLPKPDFDSALAWLHKTMPSFDRDQLETALVKKWGDPVAAKIWLESEGWSRYEHWRTQMNHLARGKKDLVSVAEDWAGWHDPNEPLEFLLSWSIQQAREKGMQQKHVQLQRTIYTTREALANNANVQLALEHVLITHLYGETL